MTKERLILQTNDSIIQGNGTLPPAGLTNAVEIALGVSSALALKSDGTVAAWGDNSHGQTNVPSGLTNIVAIAAGDYHDLALKNNGTVVAWGDTNYITAKQRCQSI